MGGVRHLIYVRFLQIRFHWKKYILYLFSFYIGFLLPVFATAQYSYTKKEREYYFYDGMEKDTLVSWMSDSYDKHVNIFPETYSASAMKDMRITKREGEVVSVYGMDGRQKDFKQLSVTKGRVIQREDDIKKAAVCILNQTDAETMNYQLGDMIFINGKKFQVIGLISDRHYKGTIYIPLSTMLTLVKKENSMIQFFVNFRDSNDASGDWSSKIQNELKEKDPNAELVYIQSGSERKQQITQTLERWKNQRMCVAVVSLVFFLLNELILLLGKLNDEKKAMAVRLAVGSTSTAEFLSSLVENICLSAAAVLFALLTITPIGKVMGAQDMILVDKFTICCSLILATVVCAALSAAIVWHLSRMQISTIFTSGDV